MAKFKSNFELPEPFAKYNKDRLIIKDGYIKLTVYLSENTKQVQKVIYPWKQGFAPYNAAKYITSAFYRIIKYMDERPEQFADYEEAVRAAFAQFRHGVSRCADVFIEQQLKVK